MPKLRILHCLRAPVGGLFRHVRDLVQEQVAAGHDVAVICDNTAADALTEQRLSDLTKQLDLGLHRVAMNREIGLSDFNAFQAVRDLAKTLEVDVIHGHGAKGGAYARLAASDLQARSVAVSGIYTPHGGSLHYDPKTLKGRVFKFLEQTLAKRSDAIIFESDYSKSQFETKIGTPECLVKVIPNGLTTSDFEPVTTSDDAADILFVGELRDLKGVDTLIEATAILKKDHEVKVHIVGDGPDRDKFEEMSSNLGLTENVTFAGAQPAREAFANGRCIVVPSRAESFPYIVLEAAAAGVPLVSTNVGGIPEITAGTETPLIQPDAPAQLAEQLGKLLNNASLAETRAAELRSTVRSRFTASKMAQDILSVYYDVRSKAEGELAKAA